MRPYSFSKLETYLKCPAWFKFSYVDVRQDYPKYSYSLGLKIHNFIRNYIKDYRKPDYSKLRETDQQKGKKAFESAVEVLGTLGEIFAVEEKFALNENKDPVDFYGEDILIRGSIDLITVLDGGLYIWDWKLGDRSAAKSMQLKIYMIATSQMYPGKKVLGAGFIYLPKGRVERIQNNGSLDNAWNELIELIQKIENDGVFEPKPSRYCHYCPHQLYCPAKPLIPPSEETDEESEE